MFAPCSVRLGGTFGFVLDNVLGSDEGFREYLWQPQAGMKYAMGALATARDTPPPHAHAWYRWCACAS